MALLLTILGIGLLLLLHEAGHYFAARAVGIKVHVFSLGFGPRIVGWHRNGCDFRLAWIPLGGYVRVAGEDPNVKPQPGDLFYASAPQRLLFYSGGIIINFLFAFLMVPFLFFIGVPFEAPAIGSVTAGGAAWEAGIRPGDRVLEVDGRSIHGFRHVHSAIALAPQESPVPVSVQGADGITRQVFVTPSYDEEQGFQGIGIRPLTEAMLGEDGQRILSMEGVPIAGDPLMTQVMLARLQRQGMEMAAEVEGEDGEPIAVTLRGEPEDLKDLPPILGVRPLASRVVQAKGLLAEHLPVGSEIVAVNGLPIRGYDEVLYATQTGQGIHSLSFYLEGSSTLTEVALEEALDLRPADVAASLQLGLHDEVRYEVTEGTGAFLCGMVSGIRILRFNDAPVRDFEDLRTEVAKAQAGVSENVSILARMPGQTEPQLFTTDLLPPKVESYDIWNKVAVEEVQTASPIEATRLGFMEARNMIGEVFTFLKRMLTGEIAAEKNLGGIITIGTATHSFANQGLIPLFFFLCLISVNLGVLNLLPIPALDGGHMLFAIYEIIARRPVSMVVQNTFQVVGVFIVLFLLVFVTFLDIQRLFN
ncbi:MAG: site-2 protease family protein [Planctomycetota bacterium]